MFKKIVTATDLLTVRDAPVLAAARIAQQNSAKLLILHVLESAHSDNRNRIKDFRTWEEIDNTPQYEATVRKELQSTYSETLLSKVDHEIKVVSGFPWEEILKYARGVRPDLIVLGPHSGRAEENGVIRVAGRVGSTVENVISKERCPVMVVNHQISSEMGSFKRVLVGIDYSVSCECALCFAAKIAQEYGSEIFIFHMIPVPPYPKYSKENYETDLENSKKRLMDFCDDYLFSTKHQYQIWGGGAPHVEILKCADKNGVDLIVMGSHTKANSGKWYSGSAVERVSYRSRCGVMVVTDPEAIQSWEDKIEEKIEKENDMDRLIHIFTTKK